MLTGFLDTEALCSESAVLSMCWYRAGGLLQEDIVGGGGRGKEKKHSRGNPQWCHATNRPAVWETSKAVLYDRPSWRFSPGPGCWKKGRRNVPCEVGLFLASGVFGSLLSNQGIQGGCCRLQLNSLPPGGSVASSHSFF